MGFYLSCCNYVLLTDSNKSAVDDDEVASYSSYM